MSGLYETSEERASNLAVIEALAQETQRPLDEVREVYESEFARLKNNARITDYVPLFASRRAKARLLRAP